MAMFVIKKTIGQNELQYGLKPGYGWNTAVFILQHVANYFRARQSNVYMSAIDSSKAFDRINHQKLTSKLIQRQLPTCFLNIFVNWYSKYSCVRWNGVLFSRFKALCGLRQGGILSPILFNIYVNDLIDSLRATNVGYSISNVFMGCITYADDLILISPSVGGLQSMLTVCTDYGHYFDIVFNAKKCMLMCVRKHYTAAGISVFIDNVALT